MEITAINTNLKRRDYYTDTCSLDICPECGEKLVAVGCTIILAVKSSSDQAQFMTNYHDSHFCKTCPVVVFDKVKLDHAATEGIHAKDDEDCKYIVAGIVDMESMEDGKGKEIGSTDNPILITRFLPHKKNIKPYLSRKNKIIFKEPTVMVLGRNDPCSCGSGLKYKKCCGRN